MPINFFIIVFAQIIVFLYFYFHYKHTKAFGKKEYVLSIFGGIGIGFLFDGVFGSIGIFSYIPKESSNAWGLSYFQTSINGILSYGVAVATAVYLIPRIEFRKLPSTYIKTVLTCAIIFVGCLFIILTSSSSLVKLFASGTLVVSGGEGLLLMCRRSSIFLSFFTTKEYVQGLKVWGQVVMVAVAYEIVNYIFPFWEWLPNTEYSRFWIELLVIVFGYMCLFHIMMITILLFRKKDH